MRKFSLILAILMLIMATVVFADSTKLSVANTEKGLLESLGIIEGVIGNEITRADFAKYAAISAGTRVDLSSSDKSNFSDVVDNSNYAPYVKAMYNAGFMSGVGNGMFGSDLPISGVDAVVVLLRIAGFEQMAKYMGGYPSGYLAVAGQKGMLKGVDVSGEAIDGDSLVKLIYNTLHTDVYQSIGYGDLVEYKEIKGEDVLAVYHNVKKTEGVMTADRFTSLYDIKTACGSLSIRQLRRVLKTHYGMTFREKLRHARMDYAAHLLLTTDFSASKISILAGYVSETSFFKAFKAHYGVTPAHYRIAK